MSRGISGNEFDKYVERFDHRSTLSKVQQQFWEAKQTFLQKIAKKEDDCVVSYDSELDAKLELFKSIVETCQRFLCVIEGYQDRIFMLAHEESCTGRFLKECGRINSNLIDKMLTATGKTLCYIAQQRIQTGVPLAHIYHDLETFQYKAVSDTLCTIEQMEKERTAYRASLLWIKSLSNKLDPDSYPELEKFRKVQNHVRKTKQKYDKKKIDCIQKIDMLSASRLNLLNQSLSNYQTAWLNFWKNTNSTLLSISNCFQDCRNYEFTVLKHLKICHAEEAIENENIAETDEKKSKEDLILLDIQDKDIENNFLEKNYKKKEDEIIKEIDLIKNDDNLLLNLENFNHKEQINLNKNKKYSNMYNHEKNKQATLDLLTSEKSENEDLLMLDVVSSESKNLSDIIFEQTFMESNDLNNLKSKPIKNDNLDDDLKQKSTRSNIEWLKLFSELDPLSKKENKKTLGTC